MVEAYTEAAPLADGWADQVGLHQLFPLLTHACMFGGGYAARAADAVATYA
ncbi:MAG: fructosamine kinase family protein [Nocardioides sp.]